MRAIDEQGAKSDYSPVWGFYVEGDPTSNHVPTLEYVSPEHGANLTTFQVLFKWQGQDDDGHELSYQLYVQKNTEDYAVYNLNDAELELTLETGNDYSWYVIVSDGVSENQGVVQTFSISSDPEYSSGGN